jgi:protein gp37
MPNLPLGGVDWVIAGGESGPDARPCHPDWVRSIRDQCQAAGVPFFFKQWGEWAPWEPRFPADVRHERADGTLHEQPIAAGATGCPMVRVGKKAAGRLLDGREWSEYPHKERSDDHAR